IVVSSDAGTIDPNGTDDVSTALAGVQVASDASGNFSFHLRRPTGTAPAHLSATEVTGLSAGSYTQNYPLPQATAPGSAARRLDFNLSSDPSVTQPGYLGYTPTVYVSPAASGLGWQTSAPAYDRGPSLSAPPASQLLRDGHYGNASGNTFLIDLANA